MKPLSGVVFEEIGKSIMNQNHKKEMEEMRKMLDDLMKINEKVEEKVDSILEEIDYLNRNQFEYKDGF